MDKAVIRKSAAIAKAERVLIVLLPNILDTRFAEILASPHSRGIAFFIRFFSDSYPIIRPLPAADRMEGLVLSRVSGGRSLSHCR